MAGEPGVGVAQRHPLGALKHLYNGLIPIDFNDTADLAGISAHGHFHDLIVSSSLNAFQDHQRAIDFA
jgi:hypothetical protein